MKGLIDPQRYICKYCMHAHIQGQPEKHCSIKTSYTSGITYISWSPDDSLFIVCGSDDSSEAIVYVTEVRHYVIVRLFINFTQSGDERCRVHQTSEDCPTCCAWHTDGSKFYVAGTRGQFFECVCSIIVSCAKA